MGVKKSGAKPRRTTFDAERTGENDFVRLASKVTVIARMDPRGNVMSLASSFATTTREASA